MCNYSRNIGYYSITATCIIDYLLPFGETLTLLVIYLPRQIDIRLAMTTRTKIKYLGDNKFTLITYSSDAVILATTTLEQPIFPVVIKVFGASIVCDAINAALPNFV